MNSPRCLAVVGLQWGDEGKGKIVDKLCQNKKVALVARWNGGPNAGHTIYKDGKKVVLHQVPSGALRNIDGLIGPECYIDIEKLGVELKELTAMNCNFNLFIDVRASLILPINIEDDSKNKNDGIRTTGCGIGPAASDRANRTGIRIADILNPHYIELGMLRNAKIHEFIKLCEKVIYHCHHIVLCDGYKVVNHILDNTSGKIIFEGAQSIALDNIHGDYPFVSQRCTTGNILSSFGMHPLLRNMGIIGVAKAYTTRSGAGPMIAEMNTVTSDRIREHGKEYGATTGRPRRCGWFEVPQIEKAIAISGADEIIITKFDVMSDCIDRTYVCVDYTGGHCLDIDHAVIKTNPGLYQDSIKGLYETLPYKCNALKYAKWMQKKLSKRISAISCGPGPDDLIIL